MQTIDLMMLATGFVSVIAILVSSYTLFSHLNSPDNTDLQRQFNALNTDFSDFFDKVQQWMRRDSTRRARAGRLDTELAEIPPMQTVQPMDSKAQLRAKLNRQRGLTQ